MTVRSQGISGTEVAALFGMSPYIKSKFALYARKKGLVPPQEQDQRMRIGKLQEPVVVQLFEEASGKKVQWFDKLIEHPKEPLIIGTPDGFVDEDAVFQAKTAGLDRAFEWGDPETDFIPPHYLIAEQHYMLLTGRKKSYVGALIGGNDFRKFELPADEEMQADILDAVRKFDHDHLKPGIPPPIDGTDESKQYLLRLFPSPTEGIREATPDEDEIVVGILQTRKELKFLEDRKEELQNKLKEKIGFAKGLTSTAGKVSWTETPETVVQSFVRKAGRTLRVYGKKEAWNG